MYNYIYHNIAIIDNISSEKVSEYTQIMDTYGREHENDKMLHIKAGKISIVLNNVLCLVCLFIWLGLLALFVYNLKNGFPNKVVMSAFFIILGVIEAVTLYIIRDSYNLMQFLMNKILCFYLCPKYNIPHRTQAEIRKRNAECERINKILQRVNLSKIINGTENVKLLNPTYEININYMYLKLDSQIVSVVDNSILYREPITISLIGVETLPGINCLTLSVEEGKVYLPVNEDGQIFDESNKSVDSEVSIELTKKLICEAIDNIPSCAVIKDCYVEHSFGAAEAFIKIKIKVKEDTAEAVQEFHEVAHNAFNTSMGLIS